MNTIFGHIYIGSMHTKTELYPRVASFCEIREKMTEKKGFCYLSAHSVEAWNYLILGFRSLIHKHRW